MVWWFSKCFLVPFYRKTFVFSMAAKLPSVAGVFEISWQTWPPSWGHHSNKTVPTQTYDEEKHHVKVTCCYSYIPFCAEFSVPGCGIQSIISDLLSLEKPSLCKRLQFHQIPPGLGNGSCRLYRKMMTSHKDHDMPPSVSTCFNRIFRTLDHRTNKDSASRSGSYLCGSMGTVTTRTILGIPTETRRWRVAGRF